MRAVDKLIIARPAARVTQVTWAAIVLQERERLMNEQSEHTNPAKRLHVIIKRDHLPRRRKSCGARVADIFDVDVNDVGMLPSMQ